MTRKLTIGLFALLLVCTLALQSAYAQGTPYIVTGSKPINARQCPRLDCPIVQTLPVGTQVNVLSTVTGDTVFGSDQWMQVEVNGTEMFVHSTLVTPATDSQPTATPINEDSAGVDTSGWNVHEVNYRRFLAPPMWVDIVPLVNDVEFLDTIEEMIGKAERDWYVAMGQACEDGTFDMVLVELNGSGALRFIHADQGKYPLTALYAKLMVEAEVNGSGRTVVFSEMTQFSAGNGFRIISQPSKGSDAGYGEAVYAVVTEKERDVFDLTFEARDTDYYTSILDGIVNSFSHQSPNM